jgi:hypothetical protein
MNGGDNTRDKVIGLERDFQHLTITVDKMAIQLGELHEAYQRGKGAAWVAIGVWSVVVGIVSANFNAFLAWIRGH